MARKLIYGNDVLGFAPSAGIITAKGYVPLSKLLVINNATKNTSIYNFSDPNTLASVSYNPESNTTTFDVSYNTSTMSVDDKIQIYYEKEDLEIKPARSYRDPVSKMRVSNPQTLIDTDFEYGSQPTKWETVKLINNVPTSYSSPFTENALPTTSVNVQSNDDSVTVITSRSHGLSIGTVIEIVGLTDSQYEGTFIVKSVASTTQFTYTLPFKSDKTSSLSTIYTIVYSGAFYTGSSIEVQDVTTSTGAASTITITTPNIHGFNNTTKLYLKNSRATKKYTFQSPLDVVGGGTTSYKSQISGLGGSNQPEYYSINKIIAEEIIGNYEINVPDTAINTSTGVITFSKTSQLGDASSIDIKQDEILIFYTPEGNSPITQPGTPSPTNVLNFTPFRVLSSTTVGTSSTITIGNSYNSDSKFIADSDGSISFGNHRFIKGNRIVSTVYPYTFECNEDLRDLYKSDDTIIFSTNYTTSTYESLTRMYLTRYNGELNTNSYPYYTYTITNVSYNGTTNKTSITVKSTYSYFNTRNLLTDAPSNIFSVAKVRNHPLSNSLYLPPSAGFSTDKYDDGQYILYSNSNTISRIPSLSDNTNYTLKQISGKSDWYRIYNANNSNDLTLSNNINIYYNLTGSNGSAANVNTVGIHTFTSIIRLKDESSISIPNRGGLENNAIVVYNSDVTPIGNLIVNNSYRIKTEDSKLSSSRFRLSETSEFVKIYYVYYQANQNYIDVYVYDTVDRSSSVGFSPNAEDGIKTAGIVVGGAVQISGVNSQNILENIFLNSNFKISNIDNYTSISKLNADSPVGHVRYVYRVRLIVPQDGTKNIKNTINTSDSSTFQSSKVVGITTFSNSGGSGNHILTQNIDGAIDDVYKVINSTNKSLKFNTDTEIPEIVKNITPFAALGSGAINFNSVNPRLTVTNNNTVTAIVSNNNGNTGWVSATGSTAYSAPVSIQFQMASGGSYYFNAGLTESTTNLTTLNYSNGYSIYQVSGVYLNGNYRSGYSSQTSTVFTDYDISTSAVYKISYDIDGNIRYYKNGVLLGTSFIGTGKSLRPFVSNYDYYYTYNMNVSNIFVSDIGLPFSSGTNNLKTASHNFADGTEVTYQVEPSNSQAISPLVHNQKYYVRVLDANFIGVSSSFEDAVNRNSGLIGFTTSGSSTATHKLVTDSVKGFLTGQGSVAISTSSTLVTGTNTKFLTDFSNGNTMRIYSLNSAGIAPGNYFESKIASVKSDKVIKLEDVPTFTSSAASYFKQTAIYPISDGKVIHRPFDGGIALSSGLIPNTKIIRQSRKYFRYQSGKGIQVSVAINFNPTYDIDSIVPFYPSGAVGSGFTSYYKVKSKFPHQLSREVLNTQSNQRIVISNITGAGSTYFNRNIETDTGFKVVSFGTTSTSNPDNSDFSFVVDTQQLVKTDDIKGFPQFTVQNWQDSSLKCGLFDDQNGFFFEYDGNTLYVVRRSSTQQLGGQSNVTRNSHIIKGNNTSFTKQLINDDYIVIRGQTYKVISVLDDTTLNVQPAYRGNSSNNIVISKVIDTKIPQSQWNIDRMDGTGESGYKININKIQMVYMDYSWYGAGSIRFGFKDQLGEVKYAHEFYHNNIFTESYFRSGNIPARYEVETFDNPLYSPSLSHWGISVIMDGRYDDDKAYLFTAESNTLPFTNGGYSSNFTGRVTQGSNIMDQISTTEYKSLSIGQEIIPTSSYSSYLQSETKINLIEVDPTNKVGPTANYKITMSKPALTGNNTSITANAASGTSTVVQGYIPLVSIRLAPSVDNGNVGNLGFRDIINRMQLTLKSAGVLASHDCEVRLILNGKLSDEIFESVTSPSLSQVYKHKVGDTVSEGIPVFAFRAQGGQVIDITSGKRSLSVTDVSLDELALLGNSILGGDGTFPDGPDVLTIAVKAIDPSTINGSSPFLVTGRITWTEAQA